MASLRRRGAISVIKIAAKATVAIFARVKPGNPASSARPTTIGFASAAMPCLSTITTNDAQSKA